MYMLARFIILYNYIFYHLFEGRDRSVLAGRGDMGHYGCTFVSGNSLVL